MSKLNGLVLVAFALMISCNGGAKDEKDQAGWDVTIRGKVGFPGKGEIKITEMRPDKQPWEDTLRLKSNYTFEKKFRILEPGYQDRAVRSSSCRTPEGAVVLNVHGAIVHGCDAGVDVSA